MDMNFQGQCFALKVNVDISGKCQIIVKVSVWTCCY